MTEDERVIFEQFIDSCELKDNLLLKAIKLRRDKYSRDYEGIMNKNTFRYPFFEFFDKNFTDKMIEDSRQLMEIWSPIVKMLTLVEGNNEWLIGVDWAYRRHAKLDPNLLTQNFSIPVGKPTGNFPLVKSIFKR